MVNIKSARDSTLYSRGEGILPYSAQRADPVFRDVFKGGARLDAAVGIAFFGIIDIAAYVAYILFHLRSSSITYYYTTPPGILTGGFPKTVKIAVFPGADMGGANGKNRLRLVAGFKEFQAGNPVRQQFDPLDIMFFFHRVGYGPDTDMVTVGEFFDDRHMFFPGPVGSVFRKERHGPAAADKLSRSGGEDLNDISAFFTAIDFKFLCHFFPPEAVSKYQILKQQL
jgi:hypothetical protein